MSEKKVAKKKPCWLAGYRKKFAYDNVEAKTPQQERLLNIFLVQIELKKRSPVKLFSAAFGATANYIWNNAKIYWRGLVERWEALEIDDSYDLVEATLKGYFQRLFARNLAIYETTLSSLQGFKVAK